MPPAPTSDRLRGIGLMCLALICFSVLDATAKWLTSSLHPLQITWMRYAVSVVVVVAILNPWHAPGVWRTKAPVLQSLRSLMLLGSTAFNFAALQYLQLAETIAIVFATPLLIALIAGPMLGEWAGPRRMAAIVVGFVGVLVITRPGIGGMHPAALFSVAGVCCYALYNLLTRKLAGIDSSQTTMWWSGLAGLALMTPTLPFVWTPPGSPAIWGLLVLVGLAGTLGHWLLILAHKRAPAAVLAPFIYSQLIWMVALGWLLFNDWPDRWTAVGASIVVASGLYLLYRERVRGVETASRGS